MSHLSLFLKGGSGGRAPLVEDCEREVCFRRWLIALGNPIYLYIYIYIYIYMDLIGISYVVKLLVELLYCVCVCVCVCV